jgi:hypothetical protein
VEPSILKLQVDRSFWIATSIAVDLLLALPLFVVKVTEPTIIAIEASALSMEAAAAAEPSKVPKRTQ